VVLAREGVAVIVPLRVCHDYPAVFCCVVMFLLLLLRPLDAPLGVSRGRAPVKEGRQALRWQGNPLVNPKS
jgi:hypothetical protein